MTYDEIRKRTASIEHGGPTKLSFRMLVQIVDALNERLQRHGAESECQFEEIDRRLERTKPKPVIINQDACVGHHHACHCERCKSVEEGGVFFWGGERVSRAEYFSHMPEAVVVRDGPREKELRAAATDLNAELEESLSQDALENRVQLRERLAELEHEQWAHWAKHMLGILKPLFGGMPTEPEFQRARIALERWERQIEAPYYDLTEEERDSDREWADRVIAVLEELGVLDHG